MKECKRKNDPNDGVIQLQSLGLNSEYNIQNITSIKILRSKDRIKFSQDSKKLDLHIPKN